MGLQLKTIRGNTINLFKTLGNTSQMKKLMTALLDIDSPEDSNINSEGWKKVKEAFEDFGFSVVYDRNLAILTAALFSAIAKSGCNELQQNVKNMPIKLPLLGDALLCGSGDDVYKILNCTQFKDILGDIGISNEYVTKYINRMKKITPWKLDNSKTALNAVKQAFTAMTGENYDLEFVSTVIINTPEDFKNLKKLKNRITSVTISDKIKKIPDSAFWNFEKLKEVTLPSSITEISRGTFGFCKNLKKITIPNTVKKIGNEAFAGCEGLKKIVIPNSVTEIDDRAFVQCKELKEIVIPNSVTKIDDAAFMECTNLEEITIPDSVTFIDDNIFLICKKLKKVKLSNSIKYIPRRAFLGCDELEEITIPKGVEAIYFKAFTSCNKLKKIIIPDSVTSIGLSAFCGCPENMEVIANDYIKEEVQKARSMVSE